MISSQRDTGSRICWIGTFTISFVLSFTTTHCLPECVQYYLPSAQSYQCAGVLNSCNYVLTPQTLTLTEAENQLEIVFNQAGIGVDSRDVSKLCFNSFKRLYCHQAFALCHRENLTIETSNGPSLSSSRYVPMNYSVCGEDCEAVIDNDCSGQHWGYLTNIIDQFRRNGNIQLPGLTQRSDCNNSVGIDNCTSLAAGTPRTDNCIPTQPPPTSIPSTPNSPDATLIAAICLGVGIPVVTVSVLLFLIIFCVCQVRKSNKRRSSTSEPQRNGSGFPNPLEDATEFKFDVPDTDDVDDPDAAKRGTLMMRQSTYHSALLNVNMSPRSGTLVKRLADKEFLKMTPKQRLQTLEFPHSNICLLKDLWETNFGMTYQGEATGLEENVVSTTIFIKSLKERVSSKVRQQFTIEMTWASGFNHPNVISLLGVCREEPQFMIYEYLDYGSLKDFLQSLNLAWFDFDEVLSDTASTCPSTSTPPLGIEDLSNISHQVAEGMDYLSKKAFVLKDLAARNCQVGHGLRVKIANFGLSYDSQSKDYCCLSSAKSTPLPLRWLAPETIQHNRFSVYSDIWSYGVLLWEVFTFGARPFDNLSNAQVVQSILSGKHLSQPDHCPDSVYEVMTRCWFRHPSRRPWFSILSKELADVPHNLTVEEKKAFAGPPSTPDLKRPAS